MLDRLRYLKYLADLNKINNAKNIKKDNKSLIHLKTKRFSIFASTKIKY